MNNKICPLMSNAEKEVECKGELCGFWFKDKSKSIFGCSIPLIANFLKSNK